MSNSPTRSVWLSFLECSFLNEYYTFPLDKAISRDILMMLFQRPPERGCPFILYFGTQVLDLGKGHDSLKL